MFNHAPVRHGEDLDRVLSLPRRQWAPGQAEALAETWSPALLNAAGLREWNRCLQLPHAQREAELKRLKIRLKPVQVMMLSEAWTYGGLHATASVGAGKTLTTWLSPIGMPMADGTVGAKRPILLIPKGLEGKTKREFRELAKFWRTPNYPIEIVPYSVLSQKEGDNPLFDFAPDMLIGDEFDYLRNPRSRVSKRVARYKANNLGTRLVSMSATDLRKGFQDIFPHMLWALGEGAPVPLQWVRRREWAEALDDNPREGRRRPLGALRVFANPAELKAAEGNAELEHAAVVKGYAQRVADTPGIIIWDEQSCDKAITIRVLKAPDDPILDEAFWKFRKDAATPDGWDISDPLSELRHGTELGCGFYYKWDPRPPDDWIQARRDWCKFIAEKIRDSQRTHAPLDTPAEVANRFKGHPTLTHWREIEPTFKPNSVAVPISASILGYAAQWHDANGPGLIWVQHDYMGRELSKALRLPYFGAKGKTLKPAPGHTWAGSIDDYPAGRSAILSAHSNRRGRNLQSLNRNLIIGPEHSGERLEQLLGRTHRQGQEHDVQVDILISCRENLRALDAACAEAKRVQTRRLVTQKALIAEWDWTHYPAAELTQLPNDHSSRARW